MTTNVAEAVNRILNKLYQAHFFLSRSKLENGRYLMPRLQLYFLHCHRQSLALFAISGLELSLTAVIFLFSRFTNAVIFF